MTRKTQPNPPGQATPVIECKLGWVIVYVDSPPAASDFYAQTFGLRAEFAASDGSYAQLDTGPTKLAFASFTLGESSFAGGVRRPAPTSNRPIASSRWLPMTSTPSTPRR